MYVYIFVLPCIPVGLARYIADFEIQVTKSQQPQPQPPWINTKPDKQSKGDKDTYQRYTHDNNNINIIKFQFD